MAIWGTDMPNYLRTFMPGGVWFFTVNLLERHGGDLLLREIDLLRTTVCQVRDKYPPFISMPGWCCRSICTAS